MEAANGASLFVCPRRLTTTSHKCMRFLSTETDQLRELSRQKNIVIKSRALQRHAQGGDSCDLEIVQKVCGIDYPPNILMRGKMTIKVELRSSKEVMLLLENGEGRRVKIDDDIFFINPELTAERRLEEYNERCLKRVIIQGIPELASDNELEQKEHSLKFVEKILSQLGSKSQIQFVKAMGKKMADNSGQVKVGFHSQEDAQSLLNDGNVNEVNINEHTFYIKPFQPDKRYLYKIINKEHQV